MRIVTTLFTRTPKPFLGRKMFTPEWVDKMARGVRKHGGDGYKLVVCTHHPKSDFKEDVEVVPLVYENRDWSCLMDMTRPEVVQERAILVGLDTIFVNDLAPIFEDTKWWETFDLVGPRCKWQTSTWNNAVVGMTAAEAERMWPLWVKDRKRAMKNIGLGSGSYALFGEFSELAWMKYHAPKRNGIWDQLPGVTRDTIKFFDQAMMSCGHLPKEFRVVFFAGGFKQDSLESYGQQWWIDHWGNL